jgi:hypothetical protein
MNEALEVDQEVTTAGDATASAQFEEANHVDPSTPPRASTPAIKRTYAKSGIESVLREAGIYRGPETSTSKSTLLDRVQHGHAGDADDLLATPSVARKPSSAAPSPAPPKPDIAVGKLFVTIKRSIAEGTHLSDQVSALLAFWVISTWFQDALTLYPCLVLTGPPHEAMLVLQTLAALCHCPVRFGAFNNAILKNIRWAAHPTVFIYGPNLDKRMAALLGSSTRRGFLQSIGGYPVDLRGPKAIYVGDTHGMKSIPHSIHINVAAPSSVEPPAQFQLPEQTIKDLETQLLQYSEKNLEKVRRSALEVSGPCSETCSVAYSLGRCIVDAPELQAEVVALLTPHGQQQIADRSDSLEALVAGAALTLCHMGKDQMFVKEIAAEVNRVLEDRGWTLRLNPEKVGHKLKTIGLLTRKLSQIGNGLFLDGATKVRVHEVAASYRMKDSMADSENLHCTLCH